MANIKNVIKIKQADFDLIFNAYPNPATISTGFSVTYDPDSMYLVDELNEMYVEKTLWTNSDPTVAFAEQDIDIPDLYQYDYIKIAYKYHKGTPVSKEWGKQYLTCKPILNTYIMIDGDDAHPPISEIAASRYFKFIDNANNITNRPGIKVFESYYISLGSTETVQNNEFMIPWEIIGIKKGRIHESDDPVLLHHEDSSASQTSFPNLSLNDGLSKYKYLIVTWRQCNNDRNIIRTVVENKLYGATSVTADQTLFRLQYAYGEGTCSRYIKTTNSLTKLNVTVCRVTRVGSTSIENSDEDCTLESIYGSDTAEGGLYVENNNLTDLKLNLNVDFEYDPATSTIGDLYNFLTKGIYTQNVTAYVNFTYNNYTSFRFVSISKGSPSSTNLSFEIEQTEASPESAMKNRWIGNNVSENTLINDIVSTDTYQRNFMEQGAWVDKTLSAIDYGIQLGSSYADVMGKTFQVTYLDSAGIRVYSGQIVVFPIWKDWYYCYVGSALRFVIYQSTDLVPVLIIQESPDGGSTWNSVQSGKLCVRNL